jgi:hypothetical protein
MQFQIVIVQPAGYLHSQAFAEIAETLALGFQAIGLEARITINQLNPSATNILLGSHLLEKTAIPYLPDDTVIYNLEQIEPKLFESYGALQSLFSRFEVWDYSEANIARLRALGFDTPIRHLPIGYMPALTRISSAACRDIDVLFYGSINERRHAVLSRLKEEGLKIRMLFGVYGAERDGYIARSKVVLNMHLYDPKIFEIVRVSYLLANRKAVVCEISPETAIEPDLLAAVQPAAYDDLVDCCRRLVRDDAARGRLEQAGFRQFSRRNEVDFLQSLMHARSAD